ncbi:flavodoxin family protein [Tenacibaculum sp. IB213877]|uniref:flavodoxin family protein n=1 Tax=Tenacibaculum sp. IB213877 TaxID=3097351 RepID=UPI002A5ABB21|nr:NAD(P)H-dependent oxidoreductase [Tenacibaculum sp. IB213877]MDY0781148.1 NAD(P)H-dependent oxidoreductase [Tenacibaculum sp. IB213877]
MNTKVIIQASSQSNRNTQKVVNYVNQNNMFDVIDLATKKIGHYSYEYVNAHDDFLPLMEDVITKYDTIIFATPVYWYTMSGTLKVFFDRLSDLIRIHKDLGRQLRGKKMAMISNSAENDRRNGFDMPFVESAKYLGMEYLGDVHTFFCGDEIHEEAKKKIDEFRENIVR